MQVNQQGNPIEEEVISFSYLTLEERREAVDLLFQHFDIKIVRTNATKHGNFELQLRPAATSKPVEDYVPAPPFDPASEPPWHRSDMGPGA